MRLNIIIPGGWTALRLSRLAPPRLVFFCLFIAIFAPIYAQAADFPYKKYTDMPGVTAEEKAAIEKLRQSGRTLIWGSDITTECFVRADGELGDFFALTTKWLEEFLGLPIQLKVMTWSEMLAGLADHTVDFSGDLTPTPERRETYLMTAPIAEYAVNYFHPYGMAPLNKIALARPPRYAFLRGAITYDQVRPHLNGKYEVIYVGDYDEAYRLMKEGEVDAFLEAEPSAAAFDRYGDVETDEFLPLVVWPVSMSARNPELAPLLSIVDKALKNGGQALLSDMSRRGRQEYTQQKFVSSLTDEERAYITDHGAGGAPIPYGMEYDNYPTSFYNDKEYAWQGIFADTLAAVADLTGLRFVRTHEQKVLWSDLLNMLETGEIRLISKLIRTQEREGRFLWTKKPYTSNGYAMLSMAETPNASLNDVLHLRVGLSADSAYTDLFHQYFTKHLNTVIYPDSVQPILAMERGEVDLVMGSHNQLLSVSHYMEMPYFKVNIDFNKRIDTFFGLYHDEVILASILDKALAALDVKTIEKTWKNRVFDYQGAAARERMPWMLAGILLLLCVVTLLWTLFASSRRKTRHLEAAVNERTLALKLQTDRAEAANRAKSDFLARMSHEIRTPLNVIIGMGDLMRADNLDVTQTDYLDNIQRTSRALLGIISDILDFSKIEAGKLDITPRLFRPRVLCDNLASMHHFLAQAKDLKFSMSIDPDVPDVLVGDETRLRQILTNFLTNAVKYTRQGFVRFTVKPTKDGMIEFVVEDSGIGVKSEDMPRLFKNFERVDEERNQNVVGAGLGLAIVKRLVELMGGRIEARSEYGAGSRFAVSLPLPSGDASDMKEKDAITRRVIATAKTAVLVVDDNALNLTVAAGFLARHHIKADCVLSGDKALKMVQEKSYHIVFMDQMMPEMDGVETTRRIRALADTLADEKYRRLPIVALTANAVEGARDAFLAADINDFLVKPIVAEDLNAVLLNWLPPENILGHEDVAVAGGGGKQEGGKQKDGVLDRKVGLANCADSEEVYRRIRRDFAKSRANTDAEIRLALASGDAGLARRLAHTLKSLALTIGATYLGKAAAQVETAIEKMGRCDKAMLTAVESALANVLDELAAEDTDDGHGDSSRASGVGSGPLDTVRALALVEKLTPLIASHQAAALELSGEIASVFASLGQISEQFLAELNDFDFPAATTTLAEIRNMVEGGSKETLV
jgi:signal transduction histidine kinase/CheY-like chemotaxis protein